ncbi:hypothetical protein GCM10008018_62900 [Paenibacillus marchantiophytorum]|uniref:Uncharacterized protein n=1 Tax=Paenibacillus marchantiophytorum TaxID=1619310 RepID=A0ABQ1FF84_9BACL|nr:hypothetical protein GCM10008018_62900 [Paenibacillus marchantiophytorum]
MSDFDQIKGMEFVRPRRRKGNRDKQSNSQTVKQSNRGKGYAFACFYAMIMAKTHAWSAENNEFL